jgi:hypothetical protein
MDILSPIEVRVLGSLIEKAVTTPDYYPLSLNALTAAANQTSNRDPVVHYDEPTVAAALETLRARKLVHIVHRGESRVERYRHVAGEAWGLEPPAIAVMAVLMLRGAQTVGELRARAARLHEFAGISDVQSEVDRLANRNPDSLVRRLPRGPGQKEVRYIQLLAGDDPVPEIPDHADVPTVGENDRISRLEEVVERLRSEVDDLSQQFDAFRREFQ